MSQGWSEFTKRSVFVGLAVAAAILLYWISPVLPPMILAFLLAYILNPFVDLFSRIRIPRTISVLLVYLLFFVALALGPALMGPKVVRQILLIDMDFDSIFKNIRQFFSEWQQIQFFGFSIDLVFIFEQVQGPLKDMLRRLASGTINIAWSFAFSLVWSVFIFIVSFYLLRDIGKINRYLENLVPFAYREDYRMLKREVAGVWNSFLRGELILCLVVGVCVGVTMWALGVRNAFWLGVMAGILEVIPSFGPILAAIPGLAFAFFLGSARLPLSSFWFTVAVGGAYTLIQQLENNFLVPRIIGRSVNLHPLVILFGVLIGASLGGILGIFLAAPVIATLRVFGSYTYRKLFDLEVEVAEVVTSTPGQGAESSEEGAPES